VHLAYHLGRLVLHNSSQKYSGALCRGNPTLPQVHLRKHKYNPSRVSDHTMASGLRSGLVESRGSHCMAFAGISDSNTQQENVGLRISLSQLQSIWYVTWPWFGLPKSDNKIDPTTKQDLTTWSSPAQLRAWREWYLYTARKASGWELSFPVSGNAELNQWFIYLPHVHGFQKLGVNDQIFLHLLISSQSYRGNNNRVKELV
jgi:hypothetical protein